MEAGSSSCPSQSQKGGVGFLRFGTGSITAVALLTLSPLLESSLLFGGEVGLPKEGLLF